MVLHVMEHISNSTERIALEETRGHTVASRQSAMASNAEVVNYTHIDSRSPVCIYHDSYTIGSGGCIKN
jgi:hypothetical protein